MRHTAQGARVKKPAKPRNQAKKQKPSNWQAIVRRAVSKRRGNFNYKKANTKTPWRNNQDGFMVTSRENGPTKNQLNSLEEAGKKQITLKGE